MRTKDGRDLSIADISADNYIVPQGEELTVHARIEVKQFDPKTGARISTPRIQKFGMKEWRGGVQSSLRKQGYTVDILHDPFKFVQENAERLKAEQAERLKAEQEAAEARKAAEIAAIKEQAKAEVLAELKAQGVIPSNDGQAKAEPETKESEQETQDAAKRPGRPPKENKD